MSTIEQLNEQIGPLVVKQVELERQIVTLNERYIGAQNPANMGAYEAQLHEKRTELLTIKAELANLRKAQIAEYEIKVQKLQREIDSSFEHFDQEEMKQHQREIQKKICQLQNIIINEK